MNLITLLKVLTRKKKKERKKSTNIITSHWILNENTIKPKGMNER